MKLEYEYLRFVEIAGKPKTKVWSCRQLGGDLELGQVSWWAPWRQYCYFPGPSVYSAGCLRNIASFIHQANAEHLKAKSQEPGASA